MSHIKAFAQPLIDSYTMFIIVFWIGIGTIIILVSVPALAPNHNTAKWVFTEFTNNTGYESTMLVFGRHGK